MNKIFSIGLMASVDAGKTTLSEALLYVTGAIKTLGKVDKKTSTLDMNPIERRRGITVFSKEAVLVYKNSKITLVDTPGHEDFVQQVKLAFRAIDIAVLVIDQAKGITAHTLRLYNLAKSQNLPIIIFLNKMDRAIDQGERALNEVRETLHEAVVFKEELPRDMEDLAQLDETLMEAYLKSGILTKDEISNAFMKGQFIPVIMGSAMNLQGVENLLEVSDSYYVSCSPYPLALERDMELKKTTQSTTDKRENPQCINSEETIYSYGEIYKVLFDELGQKITFVKVKKGEIKLKDSVFIGEFKGKIQEIRQYMGSYFTLLKSAEAGMNVALLGLEEGRIGDMIYIGNNVNEFRSVKSPNEEGSVESHDLKETYVFIPKGESFTRVREAFKILEQEMPQLSPIFIDQSEQVEIYLAGSLEEDILLYQLKERFNILGVIKKVLPKNKETVLEEVSGHTKGYVGSKNLDFMNHEKWREKISREGLILKLIPKPPNLNVDFVVNRGIIDKKRELGFLALDLLKSNMPKGIITGESFKGFDVYLQDINFNLKTIDSETLLKNVLQAFFNALWQGLDKDAIGVLEAFSYFKITGEESDLGALIPFLEKNRISWIASEKNGVLVDGKVQLNRIQEVVDFVDKNLEKSVFYKGKIGYDVAMNNLELLDRFHQSGELKEAFDGFLEDEKLIKAFLKDSAKNALKSDRISKGKKISSKLMEDVELDRIFLRTYGKSKRDEALRRKHLSQKEAWNKIDFKNEDKPKLQLYIIDGYNLLFSWEELNQLAKESIDAARELLLDILENYQAYQGIRVLVVFDGYRVKGNPGDNFMRGQLKVAFTKEAETADRFIEKTVYEWSEDYNITVITSDMAVQMAALGDGALRKSAREFRLEVTETLEEIRKKLRELND